jgi:hypothetical protein
MVVMPMGDRAKTCCLRSSSRGLKRALRPPQSEVGRCRRGLSKRSDTGRDTEPVFERGVEPVPMAASPAGPRRLRQDAREIEAEFGVASDAAEREARERGSEDAAERRALLDVEVR